MSNIPPKGSIPPNIQRRTRMIVRTDSTMRRAVGGQMIGSNQTGTGTGSGSGSDFRPTVIKKVPPTRRNTTLITLPVWPDRAAAEVTEYENCVWVIVEFPKHTLEQIEWHCEGDVLKIKSVLPSCSYTNQIALPKNRGERVDIKLNNGLFIVKFEK